MKEILKKIQRQPAATRKIIFWFLVLLAGLLFFAFWLMSAKQRLIQLNRERLSRELKLPELQESLKNLPAFEWPEIPEKQLEELEKLLREQSSPSPDGR